MYIVVVIFVWLGIGINLVKKLCVLVFYLHRGFLVFEHCVTLQDQINTNKALTNLFVTALSTNWEVIQYQMFVLFSW